MIYAVTVLFIGFVAAWFLVPYGFRLHGERTLARLCRERRAIVLTFDDGPDTDLTPKLLDLLRRHGAKATFFMLGEQLERHRALADRVVAEGHEVGSHSQHHLNAWKSDPFSVSRDVKAGQNAVRSLVAGGHLFRPPFGKLTLAGLAALTWRKVRFGWWTVDCRDSWSRREIQDVLAEIAAKNGGVVLLHDYDSYPEEKAGTDHGAYVLEITERIVAFAREHGYDLKTLGELAADGSSRKSEHLVHGDA